MTIFNFECLKKHFPGWLESQKSGHLFSSLSCDSDRNLKSLALPVYELLRLYDFVTVLVTWAPPTYLPR